MDLCSNRDVWCVANQKLQKLTSCFLDFKELVGILMTILDYLEFATMVVIMRKLWSRKNVVIFEGSFMHPIMLVTTAMEQL